MPDADIDQANLKQPALGSGMNNCLMRATGEIQESFCGAWRPSLVVSILDGDTIEVLHNGKTERIRLSGIDCPEKGQAYGKHAKQAASELVFGKEVTLQTYGKDKYGRGIADVVLPDGTNVNHTLVKAGLCWWYRKYAPRDTVLEGLYREATTILYKGFKLSSRLARPVERTDYTLRVQQYEAYRPTLVN
jgi:endonuclease YncB( thermonuclease family)